MKRETILKKAIEKAVKNGWKNPLWGADIIRYKEYECFCFIFSHDFAKAFFGEKEICLNCSADWFREKGISMCSLCDFGDRGELWQYHLQQMVLEKDPIKYLEKFLKK